MYFKLSFNVIMPFSAPGIVVHQDTFPHTVLFLNMLATNCLTSDSQHLIQPDKVKLDQVFIFTSLWFISLPVTVLAGNAPQIIATRSSASFPNINIISIT